MTESNSVVSNDGRKPFHPKQQRFCKTCGNEIEGFDTGESTSWTLCKKCDEASAFLCGSCYMADYEELEQYKEKT